MALITSDCGTWTILHQSGSNHHGLWYNVFPEHKVALITSDCGRKAGLACFRGLGPSGAAWPAVGGTVILASPPSPFSRYFNSDGREGVRKMTVEKPSARPSFLLHLCSPFSRCCNRDGEGGVSRLTVPPTAPGGVRPPGPSRRRPASLTWRRRRGCGHRMRPRRFQQTWRRCPASLRRPAAGRRFGCGGRRRWRAGRPGGRSCR